MNVYAVIMAGGSGTRFWPASRKDLPKQFLSITGGDSLIAATHARLEGLVPDERVLVVTLERHAARVREALPGLPPENVLAEPAARNTAPCVALAAHEIARRDPEAVQVVLPADHVIEPAAEFRRSLRAAAEEAVASGHLITFGIQPTFPATGYGYIEAAGEVDRRDDLPVFDVARFVEKPPLEKAREFVDSGRFFWNGGIFVWSTPAILEALAEFVPETDRAIHDALKSGALSSVYPTLAKEPIDVAVMEKSTKVRMMTIPYRWNDVGSWTALPDVLPVDGDANCVAGGVTLVAEESRRCIVHGDAGHMTALIGVEDLVVVQAKGITLVCPKDRAQDVKTIVARLEREDPDRV